MNICKSFSSLPLKISHRSPQLCLPACAQLSPDSSGFLIPSVPDFCYLLGHEGLVISVNIWSSSSFPIYLSRLVFSEQRVIYFREVLQSSTRKQKWLAVSMVSKKTVYILFYGVWKLCFLFFNFIMSVYSLHKNVDVQYNISCISCTLFTFTSHLPPPSKWSPSSSQIVPLLL